MDSQERTAYKKILAAHFASMDQPRLSVDEFLRPLLHADDRRTEAYATYDYLQGRKPEFAPFLVRVLGYSSEGLARAELNAEFGDTLNNRLTWYQQTGR